MKKLAGAKSELGFEQNELVVVNTKSGMTSLLQSFHMLTAQDIFIIIYFLFSKSAAVPSHY